MHKLLSQQHWMLKLHPQGDSCASSNNHITVQPVSATTLSCDAQHKGMQPLGVHWRSLHSSNCSALSITILYQDGLPFQECRGQFQLAKAHYPSIHMQEHAGPKQSQEHKP
jgi:hypothetical protein